MAKNDVASVDEYIAAQPEGAQSALERVREAIRKAVPEAEELISYRMPAYRLRGEGLVHFAGWKRHYSLYLASESILATFKDELAAYDVKKGTISFPLSEPVPVTLIESIVELRARQIAERNR